MAVTALLTAVCDGWTDRLLTRPTRKYQVTAISNWVPNPPSTNVLNTHASLHIINPWLFRRFCEEYTGILDKIKQRFFPWILDRVFRVIYLPTFCLERGSAPESKCRLQMCNKLINMNNNTTVVYKTWKYYI